MANDLTFKIDIDQIIRSKMGSKAFLVPGFAKRWLKKTARQDEVNQFLNEVGDLQGVPWLDAAVAFLQLKLRVHGINNLPDDSGERLYTFVSNHPLGGPDGIALGKILGHHYNGRIRYLVNDLLMNLHGLAPLCVPINKTGKQSRDFPALVDAAFHSPNHIIMFPAGICSRCEKGIVHDVPWKKAFAGKSRETHRGIVPIFFSGHNSKRFYRWANIGKHLGLKFNIAMLLLADETFRHRGESFDIYIGKPIPADEVAAYKSPQTLTRILEDIVYKLPDGSEPDLIL